MNFNNSNNDQNDYSYYLGHERHMFSWCYSKYGNLTIEEADKLANSFYIDEPIDSISRWQVFHNEAYHWAFLGIFGEYYWSRKNFEINVILDEYRKESANYDSQFNKN